jgi:hypothetical protein
MSVVSHVNHLQEKHAELENQINEESHRPMPDFPVITKLKKQKLLLKEEITRFNNLLVEDKIAS